LPFFGQNCSLPFSLISLPIWNPGRSTRQTTAACLICFRAYTCIYNVWRLKCRYRKCRCIKLKLHEFGPVNLFPKSTEVITIWPTAHIKLHPCGPHRGCQYFASEVSDYVNQTMKAINLWNCRVEIPIYITPCWDPDK
jgi:hypothetical protein